MIEARCGTRDYPGEARSVEPGVPGEARLAEPSLAQVAAVQIEVESTSSAVAGELMQL